MIYLVGPYNQNPLERPGAMSMLNGEYDVRKTN